MDAFIGEIRLFSYAKGMTGWALCDGSVLPIMQNQALYSLLGTTYGGDGKTTFALPDLRGRAIMAAQSAAQPSKPAYSVGSAGGAETVTLTMAQTPLHQHFINASSSGGTTTTLKDSIYAAARTPSSHKLYGPMSNPPVAIEPSTIQPAGGGQGHPNIQPCLALAYYIATTGEFPPRD